MTMNTPVGAPGPEQVHQPLVEAVGIGVRSSSGEGFGPTDLRVYQGGTTVLVGPAGRGRTALLLTLAGRMRPSYGTLTAFGRTNRARYLFAHTAIADIDEIDDIEQAVRVRDVVTEHLRWNAPWYRWIGPAGPEHLERLCRPVFGHHVLPPMDAFVEELPELTAALFRIAMANAACPPLLVVGGVDRLTSITGSGQLLDRLVALGQAQTVITADVNGGYRGCGARSMVPVGNLAIDASADQERTY
jgi:energy-coupling factor transporter ATP-binding protein EcfA2